MSGKRDPDERLGGSGYTKNPIPKRKRGKGKTKGGKTPPVTAVIRAGEDVRVEVTRKNETWEEKRLAINGANYDTNSLKRAKKLVRNYLLRRFPGAVVRVTIRHSKNEALKNEVPEEDT